MAIENYQETKRVRLEVQHKEQINIQSKRRMGVLLINLGTPDSPSVPDVRRYLKQFLSDPRVIDLPRVARWLLLRLVILPFRPKQSAYAYQEIWTEAGSPLLIHSQSLTQKVSNALGDQVFVELGMRYGQPSIESAIEKLTSKGCEKLIVLPLFPQYASASTGSAIEETFRILSKYPVLPEVKVIKDFYDDQDFIHAQAIVINKSLENIDFDYLLMSYHGLPERQVAKAETIKNCNRRDPCPAIQVGNLSCYRAQCYQTSRQLAKSLALSDDEWGVGFQSRLGRVPWIQPYTDEVLTELAAKGVKKLAVCCPSFVADCLETIEEIGIRAKEQWLSLGGETCHLIPCLNDDSNWVEAITKVLYK